ncbi:MAG: YceI family protein [Burkholderiales bacterium]
MSLRTILGLVAMCAALAVTGCGGAGGSNATGQPSTSASAEPDLLRQYETLATAGGKVIRIDPAESVVRIYAFRAGPAAKVGHNHVLSAPRFVGFYYSPPPGTGSGRFDLEFRLDELVIDEPGYRATLGVAFATKLSPEAIQGTQDHMLGEDNLQADKYPFVRVKSIEILGESPKFMATVEISMHGQRKQLLVPLTVEGRPDRLTVSGAFAIRQSDFGAKPYSVLGGLMAVLDEVFIEFTLKGK